MKKLFLTMLLGMMALGAVAGSKFTIQGWFLCEGDSVTFEIIDCEYQVLFFETRAASGEMMELSINLEHAAMLSVYDGRQGYQRHQLIPAIPGDTVLFYMEGEPYYRLGGSQFYIDYDEAVRALEPLEIELYEARKQDVDDQYLEEVFNNYEEALLAYIKDHPDQEASVGLLGIFAQCATYEQDDALERGDALLTERVRNSVAANLYKPLLPQLEGGGTMALDTMAQGGNFTLAGQVKGQGNKVFYALTDASGGAIDDNMLSVTDDKVNFSFDLEDVGWLMVFNYSRMLYMLPAIPGESVTINGDIDNYTLNGSALYREFNEVTTAVKPLQDTFWKYDFKQACQGEIAGKSTEEVFNLYQSKVRENYQPVTDAVLSFIREHHDHESSMLALKYLNYAEDIEKAGDIISEEVLDGRLNPYYKVAMDNVTRFGASNPLLNKMAPDFKLKDINGKKLSLGKLRGKWVLLNFWSSTCPNAVSQFPMLKEMYTKYKDHLEVLGVDCEDDEAEWMAAVKDTYKLPWLNVLGVFDDPQSPVKLYDETATPAYFLIAPSGKVSMKSSSIAAFDDIFKILFK